jgi:ubiquinone/menaquinone biosynthesis C-methylase UbiE
MDAKAHWDRLYLSKRPDQVSWYQPEPTLSLDLILRFAPTRHEAIVDVGGGTSTLVDRLLERGYSSLTVMDLSPTALAQSRTRLGAQASRVQWLEADVLEAEIGPATIDAWHDRAVFHFLTDAADRRKYTEQVRRAIRTGGYVLVATFADDGPTTCSGLPVSRYSPDALHHEFGAGFRLVESVREQHVTPTGRLQAFVYCLCRHEPISGVIISTRESST